MNDELKQKNEPLENEQLCPRCGSNEWDWSTVWVVGMETQAKMCTDCGYVYGGDLE